MLGALAWKEKDSFHRQDAKSLPVRARITARKPGAAAPI
jgi:hypothetical protein